MNEQTERRQGVVFLIFPRLSSVMLKSAGERFYFNYSDVREADRGRFVEFASLDLAEREKLECSRVTFTPGERDGRPAAFDVEIVQ